ncbi:uncharacterized protein V6R79_018889 [Siganus canaliculatus]
MEETFMKFAKSSGGLLGLFNMLGAYQKWCRTTSARAQLHELTLEMCGMIDDPDCPKRGKHRELDPAQIRKYEEAVKRVILTINGFTNPCKIPDKNRLYSLASGAPVDPEVEVDVLQAEAAGLEKCKRAVVCVDGRAIDLTSTNGKSSDIRDPCPAIKPGGDQFTYCPVPPPGCQVGVQVQCGEDP